MFMSMIYWALSKFIHFLIRPWSKYFGQLQIMFFDNLVNGSIYSNIIIFVRWEQCWLYDRIFWFDLDLLIALANPSFDEVEYLFSKELLLFLYLIQDLYRGCFCLFCCWLWCCWADISVYITYIALNFNDQPFQTMIKLEPKYFL